jgi:hypothetical protein
MRLPRIEVDFARSTIEFDGPGGERVREGLPPSLFPVQTSFQGMVIDVERGFMAITLPEGSQVDVELGVGELDDPVAGRRVVYLDQNQWSAMAAWRHGHRAISSSEADAAARLADLAARQHIVLPMSAGHLVETVPLYDEPRVALATTVLEFSRGWQLRHPTVVAREELERALKGEPPVAENVANLGADVLFTQSLRPVDGSGLPGVMATALPRLVNAASIYETMIHPQAMPNREGDAATARWAQNFADLGTRMEAENVSRERALKVAHAVVLMDRAEELAQLASQDQVKDWQARAFEDVTVMPFLGRFRAVVFARLRNASGSWTGNDFIDLNYLCCAAGYTDVVVGEKRTIGDLRTARGVPGGVLLATSLAEAVDLLDSST